MLVIGEDSIRKISKLTCSADYFVEQTVFNKILNNRAKFFPILKNKLGCNITIESLGKRVEDGVWDDSPEPYQIDLKNDDNNMLVEWWR